MRLHRWLVSAIIGVSALAPGLAAAAERSSSMDASRSASSVPVEPPVEDSSTAVPTGPLTLNDAAPGTASPVVVEYQLLRSEGEALQVCEAFLDRIEAGNYDAAFQVLRPFFPVSDARFDKLSQETRRQHGLAELQFGAPVGRVFLSAETVRDSLLRFRFLEKFEWDAMYWDFVFYRPEHGWMLHGVGFDDEVQTVFK